METYMIYTEGREPAVALGVSRVQVFNELMHFTPDRQTSLVRVDLEEALLEVQNGAFFYYCDHDQDAPTEFHTLFEAREQNINQMVDAA